MSIFTRSLPAQYRLLGEDAVFTPQAGTPVDPVRVIFDRAGGSALDGMQQLVDPTVRVMASQVPAIARGDRFTIAGVQYKAREAGLPHLDGEELIAPLASAQP